MIIKIAYTQESLSETAERNSDESFFMIIMSTARQSVECVYFMRQKKNQIRMKCHKFQNLLTRTINRQEPLNHRHIGLLKIRISTLLHIFMAVTYVCKITCSSRSIKSFPLFSLMPFSIVITSIFKMEEKKGRKKVRM